MSYDTTTLCASYLSRSIPPPRIITEDTASTDAQHILSAVGRLLSRNGWGAHDVSIRENYLYYIPIVIHSANHFLVDQLAIIVQMERFDGNLAFEPLQEPKLKRGIKFAPVIWLKGFTCANVSSKLSRSLLRAGYDGPQEGLRRI